LLYIVRIDDPADVPACCAADVADATPSIPATVLAIELVDDVVFDVVVELLDLQPVIANANIVHSAIVNTFVFIFFNI